MRIAMYARISTNEDRQDFENQLIPLRRWAYASHGKIVAEYKEQASGTKSNRKVLHQMLEDAAQRKFDILMIWALDRLSREGIIKMVGYLEHLKSCGVQVVSLREDWLNTKGPVSDLLIAIFSWVAKQEQQRMRERVVEGLNTAKSKGRKLGRPVRVVDMPKILELRSQGQSVREIAQTVGIPKSTVAKALSTKPNQIPA